MLSEGLITRVSVLPAPVEACRDLLEVVEDRAGLRSTLVASQRPIDKWHPAMADPTLADTVLDRLTMAAHRINLKGPSLRPSGDSYRMREARSKGGPTKPPKP